MVQSLGFMGFRVQSLKVRWFRLGRLGRGLHGLRFQGCYITRPGGAHPNTLSINALGPTPLP